MKKTRPVKKMIILTSPSGGGKTTVARHLLKTFPNLSFSVSATTRRPRSNEKNGIQYYFLTEDKFKKLLKKKAFVEYEEVYPGLLYGTLKSELARIWDMNHAILFDVDVKGAKNIKSIYKKKAFAIFVKPPSVEVLVERLRKRGTETEESLKARIARYDNEIKHEKSFDYVLINDDLKVTLQEAETVCHKFLEEE